MFRIYGVYFVVNIFVWFYQLYHLTLDFAGVLFANQSISGGLPDFVVQTLILNIPNFILFVLFYGLSKKTDKMPKKHNMIGFGIFSFIVIILGLFAPILLMMI